MGQINLSYNLHHLMKIHGGLSISELARQTRIPQPTLHHILNGATKKPRKEALEALAKFFAISIAQLTGTLPLPIIIPKTIKESLKITTIPIIPWGAIKNWPMHNNTIESKKIILDRKVGENAFAIILNDSSMEPLFPENSILIFDPSEQPKDRAFALVYFSQNDSVIFNRLFVDKSNYYLKQDQQDDNFQLIKLKLNDKIIAVLIEVRLQF